MNTLATSSAGPGKPAAACQAFDRFVGLDVHKRIVVASVHNAAGERLHGESFPCDAAGLKDFATRRLTPTAAVALEATSNTWAVAAILQNACGRLVISNPMRTKAIAQAAVKTDKVDAAVLAHLLRCDYLPGVWMPDEATRRLRQLTTRRTTLVQDATAIRNRIHSHVAGELIEVPVADLFSPTGLEWLKQFPHIGELVRGFLDSDLRLLEALEKEIVLVDGQLAKIAYRQDQAKLLMTLPGVDYPVALTLLGALGDVDRFKYPDQAAAYLGLAPSTKQSADHCYHGPITKQGSTYARWMMIQAAQHLDRHPGPLGVFFRRLAGKKNRNIAVVATARKLVRIALMMLKSNEPYRYAQPATVKAKLARLRIKGGGARRVGGTAKSSPRHPNYGKGPGQRATPDLAGVYQAEGLPAPADLDHLPPGEQRMLQRCGIMQRMRQQRQASVRSKTPARKAAASEPLPAASGHD